MINKWYTQSTCAVLCESDNNDKRASVTVRSSDRSGRSRGHNISCPLGAQTVRVMTYGTLHLRLCTCNVLCRLIEYESTHQRMTINTSVSALNDEWSDSIVGVLRTDEVVLPSATLGGGISKPKSEEHPCNVYPCGCSLRGKI